MTKPIDNRTRSHMIFHVLLAVFMIAQIAFFIIYFGHGEILSLKIIGTLLWVASALLGWLPIYTFRKNAGVPKRSSYVKTTKLVTTGIYSVIRHPQYLAGIFLSLAFILVSQHWTVLVLGVPVIIIFYIGGVDEDRFVVKKFGKEYEDYMKRVPRFNFILGIIRRLEK